ncbi:tetratricopeptide repeat protein [Leeuwenhoekiella aestuarii]|uniref:Tetratricopeptide repeat protein n=1 Tax=Leeuwenhoekiella aestuarii TaxID=2249426 RepID=A0A4Q0NVM5_9FLAO|nr:tetratricopeptide repeat protein [Leeuwenhoekiella aestuarii]RXG15402.1 tetratricopeptide repeat protein [Leeuwenhoekiella aestuarii]RXG17491.1 tetratricopeptide repeat protein [Leeuwenhoekiella aestuarii]
MATYQKRGYKPKTKEEVEEQVHEESATAEVFDSLDEGATRTEAWVEENQKPIFIGIAVIVLAVLGYLAFEKFIQEPKELEASNEMYQAQNYFNEAIEGSVEKDSLFSLALNGGEGKYGFLDIIDNYGSTKAGNLAHYYAGMAFLNTNKYQEAIDQLEDFSSDDMMLAPLAKGAIGDAFMQLEQPEDALSYYKEAAEMSTNDFTTPRFLMKAAQTAIALGENDKAASFLNTIKEDYSESAEAANVPLYLGMTEAE